MSNDVLGSFKRHRCHAKFDYFIFIIGKKSSSKALQMAFPVYGILHGTRHAKDPGHGIFMLNGLTWMQKKEKFCDVTLKIGKERKLRAHRAVLALSSRYFEALFGTNWKESRSEEVELLGFDENAVANLVRFAYSGSIDITRDNVQFLLEAANYLEIEFVQKACSDFILDEHLDADSCLAGRSADRRHVCLGAVERRSEAIRSTTLHGGFHETRLCKFTISVVIRAS